MTNVDKFYSDLGSHLEKMSYSDGPIQKSFWQHVGKITNQEESLLYGNEYDKILNKLERIMKGEKAKHWEGQNKLSDLEKQNKKVIKNSLQEGW